MDHSRRRILALTSSLSLSVLAGCTGILGSDDGGDSGGESGGGNTNDGGGSDAQATTSPTPTESPTPAPEPASEFLVRTRNVMDEIRWFGTEYESARRQYLLKVKPVMETIEKLQDVNTLTVGDVEELRSKTTSLATYVSEELSPHFTLDAALERGNNVYVRNFEAAVRQDDTAAQRDALSRLDVFYTRATNESFLGQNLSADPIEAPLHDLLSSDTQGQAIFGVSYPPGDNFTTQTFSDEYSDRESDQVRPHVHEFPTGQRVYAHAHEYGAGHDIYDHENERPNGRIYAFSDGSVDILEDTQAWRERVGDYEPAYTNVFDATVVRQGRVDYAYVMANELVTGTDNDEQFAAEPIFVQRFESEEAAAAGVETLFSTTLGEDGMVRLANRVWTRVYYDYDGPNLYANLHQIGEFILATGVSPRPHRNRTRDQEWPLSLKLSWIGMEEPATPTPQSDGDG